MLGVSKVWITVLYYEQLIIIGYVYQRCQKKLDLKYTGRDVMLCMLKVSKRELKYTVRSVMLCMSKVLKENQNTL